MLVKNRSFFILIDLAAMAIAYVMTLFALYGTLPSSCSCWGREAETQGCFSAFWCCFPLDVFTSEEFTARQ